MTPMHVLRDATRRFVRTVDGLEDEAHATPTRLPGWTRAHVIAHVTLNAEGLARALEAAARSEQVAQYDSNESREADIAELAAASPAVLRERFLASCATFEDVCDTLSGDDWDATLRRTREGSRTWPARETPGKRLVEVEVHHADLEAGYARTDWPLDSSLALVDALVTDLGGLAPLTLRAHDAERLWHLGSGGPVVTGTAADLAWWLTGRGPEGIAAESGPLPDVPPR